MFVVRTKDIIKMIRENYDAVDIHLKLQEIEKDRFERHIIISISDKSAKMETIGLDVCDAKEILQATLNNIRRYSKKKK